MFTPNAYLLRSMALLCLLGLPLPGMAAPAGSLVDLLEQTRSARSTEAKANEARVAKFQAERNRQAELLAAAKAELAQANARSNALSAQFDANEKQLVELQQQLDAKGGNLGELFGVTRQVAADFSSVVHNSMITAQFPQRDEFTVALSKSKALPSITELEQLWFEIQREMTESGRVVKFNANIVAADGTPSKAKAIRVGAFTAVSDGEYLSYLPNEKSLAVLPRQLEQPHSGNADDLEDATEHTAMTVDPTRGVLMALAVQRPTLMERINQGHLVGYIILLVGFAGAGLSIYQLQFLLQVGRRVKWQLANLQNPTQDNPLGRVLLSFRGNAAKAKESPEVVELRLSEAVLREVPPLERFQSFLRLAVAAGPLLGLVGTVIGMIITFQSITESGGGDPRLMATGISQAMVATVLGLGIAIPLLFMNALLQTRSKQIVQVLDEQSTGLLAERLEEEARA